ncbi:hypothetical protein Barb7_02728 [Bacteroidales bacterium Barb7]|nr:hypothetical protein Barb7_02728 [Bacteroidales bacterium Barb7]
MRIGKGSGKKVSPAERVEYPFQRCNLASSRQLVKLPQQGCRDKGKHDEKRDGVQAYGGEYDSDIDASGQCPYNQVVHGRFRRCMFP